MVETKARICDFRWKARDFVLKGVDGNLHACRRAGRAGPETGHGTSEQNSIDGCSIKGKD
jgi:hypothetical protein